MIDEVLATERPAASTYLETLELDTNNAEFDDLIEQIYFAELTSVEELTQLMQP